jgi:hypothetical protein
MWDGALESAVSKECGLAFKAIYRHARDKECVPLSSSCCYCQSLMRNVMCFFPLLACFLRYSIHSEFLSCLHNHPASRRLPLPWRSTGWFSRWSVFLCYFAFLILWISHLDDYVDGTYISVLAVLMYEEVRNTTTLVLYPGERKRSYAKVRGKVILNWGYRLFTAITFDAHRVGQWINVFVYFCTYKYLFFLAKIPYFVIKWK